MENEAWKCQFYIDNNSLGDWIVMEKGKIFSYNSIIYKTRTGAIKGAKAIFNKINKEFEKSFLINK